MGVNYTNNLIRSRVERSRFYTNMGGVDFSRDPSQISVGRFAYLENMYRDYEGEGGGLIESVPGFRILAKLSENVRKIYLQKSGAYGEHLLLLTDTKLYRLPIAERDNPDALVCVGELPEGEVVGYPFGDAFYLISGGEMFFLSAEGSLQKIGNGDGERAPYIPTTHYNGTPYEQRNLLSDRFLEVTVLEKPLDYIARSEGLLFEITDETQLTCAVSGRQVGERSLYIPSTVEIGGKRYRVTSVAPQAFMDDTDLEEVYFPLGMEKIGSFAFLRCTTLERVIFSDSITTVEGGAFNGCEKLSYLYFGEGLMEAKNDFLDLCPSLSTLHFAISEKTYQERFPTDPFSAREKVFLAQNHFLCADIPLVNECKSLLSLTRDGEEIPYSVLYGEEGKIRALRISMVDQRTYVGAKISALGIYQEEEGVGKFLANKNTDADALRDCRVCELFDGRIFLAGNPLYPNTVFYTERDGTGQTNPTYFGVYNRFEDGIGSFPVNALLSVGNTLAVFKENDDGAGSIFYHTPKETGDGVVSKIYPVCDIHSGMVTVGAVISYYDEPIFLSENGICALKKSGLNSERSVKVRSHRIHPRLLSGALDKITLAKWCGYLVVCREGEIFLGDYRQFSENEQGEACEWYYLNRIGTYSGDEIVYRFHPTPSPYYQGILPDEVTTDEVRSEIAPDGQKHYYVKPSYTKYEVYPTRERRGGVFSPAKLVFGVGKLLFFVSEDGTLCVFNNDMRGTPPKDRIFESEEEMREYERYLGNRIHKSYYSFAGHPPHYALSTKADNCDIPHLEKDGVRDSLTFKCRMVGTSDATLEIKTEKDGYETTFDVRGGVLDFGEMDFYAFAFSGEEFGTFSLRHSVKRFIEKQISLTSDSFESPLALSSIAYRFTIRGKIKNK